MSTSGVYTYTTSLQTIITSSLRKINVVGDYESLTTYDPRYLAGFNCINPMFKHYMTMGMPVWDVVDTTIQYSQLATTSGVTIGLTGQTINQVAPLKVIQALRRDNLSQIDTPMNIYTYEDYELLNNKYATGAPLHIYHQPFRNYSQIRIWPLPDPTYWQVNGVQYIRYHIPFTDFVNTTDEPDFPIQWTQALIYHLAYLLAPEYGLDTEQRSILKRDADIYLEQAMSFDVEEGSIKFQPAMYPGLK